VQSGQKTGPNLNTKKDPNVEKGAPLKNDGEKPSQRKKTAKKKELESLRYAADGGNHKPVTGEGSLHSSLVGGETISRPKNYEKMKEKRKEEEDGGYQPGRQGMREGKTSIT